MASNRINTGNRGGPRTRLTEGQKIRMGKGLMQSIKIVKPRPASADRDPSGPSPRGM